MKYLESLNITHRDLAIRNCLVYDGTDKDSSIIIDNNQNLNIKNIFIKITDLAICLPEYRKDYYFYNNSKLLPVRYMPAEALFESLYSPSSDVWSFGILIWQLFTNCTSLPFSEWSNNDYLYNLKLSMYSLVLTVNTDTLKRNDRASSLLTNNLTLNKNDKLNFPLTQFSSLKFRDHQKCLQQSNQFDLLNVSRSKINDTFITCCLNMALPFNCTKEIHDLLIECCNINMIKRPKFKDIYLFLHCKLYGNKF